MENITEPFPDPFPNEGKKSNKLALASIALSISGFAALSLGMIFWWVVFPFLGMFIAVPDFLQNLTGEQAMPILLVTTIIFPLLLSVSGIVMGVLFLRKWAKRDEIAHDRTNAIAGIIFGIITILCLIIPIVNYVLISLFANSNFLF